MPQISVILRHIHSTDKDLRHVCSTHKDLKHICSTHKDLRNVCSTHKDLREAHTRTLSPENSFYHDNEMPNMDSKKKHRKESLCLQLVSELPVLVIT